MQLEQISVFVENRSGRLAKIFNILAQNQINVRAISLADTSDFGVLRLISSDQKKAWQVLEAGGFTLGRVQVVAVELPDQPGALSRILNLVSAFDINVEYMYACARRDHNAAIIIFKFDKIDEALDVLATNGHIIIENL